MSEQTTRPLVYEVNTRCLLNDLSARLGVAVDLARVPDDEVARWRRLGFTHIWLMGVWTTGPRSRDCFLHHRNSPALLTRALPDWREADVGGSPYAIAEYRVPAALGGEPGLEAFRIQLHRHKLRLLLDFVPNHVGLDHPWLSERPELFVQSTVAAPETFQQITCLGPRRLAHGKDPFFSAWIDTAQLDYRRAETREAVIAELRSIASRCDGVRCDMPMLLLNEVFTQNWEKFPSCGIAPTTEFWSEAISAVKRPGFLFVAEAYWDLEERLQTLGFDFTYDKRMTDFIVERRWTKLVQRLSRMGNEFRRRSVHFLENHDEPRIANRLSVAEHRAAAWLTLSLPGMCLLHEGQLTGARIQLPVQLNRRPAETPQPEIAAMYEELLGGLGNSFIGTGQGELIEPLPVAGHEESVRGVVLLRWAKDGLTYDLVAVNLAAEPARFRVPSPPGAEQGPVLELPPHGARLLRFAPST